MKKAHLCIRFQKPSCKSDCGTHCTANSGRWDGTNTGQWSASQTRKLAMKDSPPFFMGGKEVGDGSKEREREREREN